MPGSGYPISESNAATISQLIPEFLCPSDLGTRVKPEMGPTNYAMCAGSGMGGRTPFKTDGAFFVNSSIRFANITDGASHTIAASESLLGFDGARDERGSFANTSVHRHYKFALGFSAATDLTDARCDGAQAYNSAANNGNDPRGFGWCSGEYRSTMYNHYYPPNAVQFDCITSVTMDPSPPPAKPRLYSAYGWRAARSLHGGGVNALVLDGSVRFVSDSIDLAVWRAASTRRSSDRVGHALEN